METDAVFLLNKQTARHIIRIYQKKNNHKAGRNLQTWAVSSSGSETSSKRENLTSYQKNYTTLLFLGKDDAEVLTALWCK